jgi:hypothetical protein
MARHGISLARLFFNGSMAAAAPSQYGGISNNKPPMARKYQSIKRNGISLSKMAALSGAGARTLHLIRLLFHALHSKL